MAGFLLFKGGQQFTSLVDRAEVRITLQRCSDCPKPAGAVCESMFKKPNSLYEVALMSIAGALFIVLLVKAAFAFGFG
jgi:hypothetical protein